MMSPNVFFYYRGNGKCKGKRTENEVFDEEHAHNIRWTGSIAYRYARESGLKDFAYPLFIGAV